MSIVLLDTSLCIEILRGHPPPDVWKSYRFCISTVIEAELWAGMYHSGGKAEQLKLQRLFASVEILPFDRKAAEATGKILGTLTKAGQKIGDFDSQIAGHALAINALLATKNSKHFKRVEGLRILEWA
jgi:tRNA(fMet)-specific endonuclease VapC